MKRELSPIRLPDSAIATGSLALILHAHLPFVRHPEQTFFHEERWLFEAITESYVPLLRMVERLVDEGVPCKLSMSWTPTVCAMLKDTLLIERFIAHLEQVIALAQRERKRAKESEIRELAQFYRTWFSETRRVFVEQWNGDLLAVVRKLEAAGALEVVASAATHGILPILGRMSRAAEAQIAIGCDDFRETFQHEPHGFWLPECAFDAGLGPLLAAQNVRWFGVDSHAFICALPAAKGGTLFPCVTPAGPAAFARDTAASRQVWSSAGGYPGDSSYRDFYRDIGFDLTSEQLHPFETGAFTGIKYHRITGRDASKELYVPEAAQATAQKHAAHFVELCRSELAKMPLAGAILTVPFDAELFGHWWFEGPVFLEHVFRQAAETDLKVTTPTEYLSGNPALQVIEPAASSWGDKGFLEVWLDEKCAWIYPHLAAASRRMTEIATSQPRKVGAKTQRVLRQLARELLLAQASDWPFMIRNGTAIDYATRRVRDHLARFDSLAQGIETQAVDTDFLAQCEQRDNLFPNLNWRHYRAEDGV